MKKILFLLVAIFIFGSCCEPSGKPKRELDSKVKVKSEQSK